MIFHAVFLPLLHLVGKIRTEDRRDLMRQLQRDMLPEEKVIRKAVNGDTSAMRLLYDTHIRYLTAVCSRYIAEDDDVKEVLQESFTKILTSLGNFEYRGENSLRAWMTKIVVNEALSLLRKKSRKRSLELDDSDWELPAEETDDSLHDIPTEVIIRMIRQLPEGFRTVFNLYVFGDLSQVEIARMLKIEPKTVSSQFARAKAKLLNMIHEYKKVNKTE